MGYTNDKAAFLKESDYVGQVRDLVGAISHTTNQQDLKQKG